MIEDINNLMCWVVHNVDRFGGDLSRLFLVGQSAGAHLTSLALLQNLKARIENRPISWDCAQLRGYIGVSGVYDVGSSMVEHFNRRGLPTILLHKIMNATSDHDLAQLSAAKLIQEEWIYQRDEVVALLPNILLIHGSADQTVHAQSTDFFALLLIAAHCKVQVRYYTDFGHSTPI